MHFSLPPQLIVELKECDRKAPVCRKQKRMTFMDSSQAEGAFTAGDAFICVSS